MPTDAEITELENSADELQYWIRQTTHTKRMFSRAAQDLKVLREVFLEDLSHLKEAKEVVVTVRASMKDKYGSGW